MRKKKRVKKTLPFIVVVALLLTLLPGMTLTAHGQDFVADAGTAPYPVSVNIVASTPNGAYNGVMVHLKVESGMDQLQMYGTGADTAPMRFVRGLSLPTGSSSYNDYNSDKDIWTCGFLYYAARNPIEAASMTVGRVEFTYVGDEPVKITLLGMDLVRIVDFSEDHDILANSEREPVAPPVAEINITRASGPEGFVAVTDISGVPSTATAGVSRTLTSSVVPTDATNKDIIWTVKDAGTTGATIVNGNRMNTTDVGTAVLTATIVNGRGTGVDFVKDFPIAVGSAPFVAVESIAGLPSEATVGEPLVLTGTVMPSDATNKTIEWDIAEAAFTGAKITGGNIFEATSGGTVVISATVRNGSNNGTSDYVRSFTVTVKEPPMFIPVEDIIGLPSATMAGSILTLAGTVDPPDATNQTIRWDIKDAGTTGATRTGNLLRTETAGYVVMTATISSGLAVGVDYVQEFGISVSGGTPPQFKPVTNITGIPTTIMEKVWTSLVGTVVPSDATNKIIVWSVEDNDIGAVINAEKQLYAEAAGTVKVTATIANGLAVGTPYTKDFTIEIQSSTAPFVQVTGITGWTDKVGVGLETELGGTVQPPNATYKDIKWSLVNDTDGTLVDGVLKATEVGTVTVIATVVNGLGDGEDYVSEPITINVVPVYTVEFDLAGGTRTGGGQTEQIVMAGGSATAPTLAARTGYKFDGWDKVFTNVNDDLLVKAIWTATGGGGGGTGGSTNHGKQPGSSATITDPVTPLDPEPGDTGDTGDTGNDPVVRPPVDGNTGNSGNNTVVGIDDGDKVPLGDVPKTGMDNMMIIFALLGMSLATMLATRFVRRKGTN